MFAFASKNPFRSLPVFLAAAPLLLTHCSSGSDTWTDPNNAAPAAKLEVTLPVDANGYITENPVGQPVSVQIAMIQTGPGTCHTCGVGGCGGIGNTTETECDPPDTTLDFQLTAVGCDQDLCDVVGIQHGDPATGDTVTIVPHAGRVTVRATGASGSLVASGFVQVAANCTSSPNAPDCQ
jgi:hypothetical protein